MHGRLSVFEYHLASLSATIPARYAWLPTSVLVAVHFFLRQCRLFARSGWLLCSFACFVSFTFGLCTFSILCFVGVMLCLLVFIIIVMPCNVCLVEVSKLTMTC